MMLSRPSVSGAYLRNTPEKQLLGYQLYGFQYVAAVVFFFIGISCTVSSRYAAAADVFLGGVSVVLFPVRSRCFFLAVEPFRPTEST